MEKPARPTAEAVRLCTAFIRAERFSGAIGIGLTDGTFAAIFKSLRRWANDRPQ